MTHGHPPGQCISNFGDQHGVSRTGENIATGCFVCVNVDFERKKNFHSIPILGLNAPCAQTNSLSIHPMEKVMKAMQTES